MPRTLTLFVRSLFISLLLISLSACEPPAAKPAAVESTPPPTVASETVDSEPAVVAEPAPPPQPTADYSIPSLSGTPVDVPGYDPGPDSYAAPSSSYSPSSSHFDQNQAMELERQRAMQQQRMEQERRQRQSAQASEAQSRARAAAEQEQAMLARQRMQELQQSTGAAQPIKQVPKPAPRPAPAPPQPVVTQSPPRSPSIKAQSTGLQAFTNDLQDVKETSPPPATTTLERYPSVEGQSEVEVAQTFSVQVSLTEDQITPEVIIKQGQQTSDGKLGMTLPQQTARVVGTQLVWDIDVVLSAPGFELKGADRQNIVLPSKGDSDPALFTLSAQAIKSATQQRKLYVTFWHKGAYLAKVIRPITVVNKTVTQSAPARTERVVTAPAPPIAALNMNLALKAPDLTLWLQYNVSDNPDEVLVLMHSPYLQPTSFRWTLPKNLRTLLSERYQQISYLDRGEYRDGTFHPNSAQVAANVATMHGFGRELYQRYAPPPFKEAFWALKEKLGAKFTSIQVFTNDPVIPWELMRPQRGKAETDFLGIDFRLARWHVNDGGSQLDRPPQQLLMNDLMLIAPNYDDKPLKQVARVERAALRAVTGVHQIDGNAETFGNLLRGSQRLQGIVHFAGHGVVQHGQTGIPEYAIKFEKQTMNLLMMRGMVNPNSENHPFYFFNACDVGQAQQVANFVDGWAPSVLEAGASGYVGGLWPLDDQGAAEFASNFYTRMNQQAATRTISVSDLLRDSRKQFYKNGNPTFLAYVYYGDPNMQFQIP